MNLSSQYFVGYPGHHGDPPGYYPHQVNDKSKPVDHPNSEQFRAANCMNPVRFNYCPPSDPNQLFEACSAPGLPDKEGSYQFPTWVTISPIPPSEYACNSESSVNENQHAFASFQANNAKSFRPSPKEDFIVHPLFPLLQDLVLACHQIDLKPELVLFLNNLPDDVNQLIASYMRCHQEARMYYSAYYDFEIDKTIRDQIAVSHAELFAKLSQRKVLKDREAKSPVNEFCEQFDEVFRKKNNSKHCPLQEVVESEEENRRNQSLDPAAVEILLEWLDAHAHHPYPNDDEKDELLRKTRLSIHQLNYWFVNARRRLLPRLQSQQKQLGESSFNT